MNNDTEWRTKIYIHAIDMYKNPKWDTEHLLAYLVSQVAPSPQTPAEYEKLEKHIRACSEAIELLKAPPDQEDKE